MFRNTLAPRNIRRQSIRVSCPWLSARRELVLINIIMLVVFRNVSKVDPRIAAFDIRLYAQPVDSPQRPEAREHSYH